VSNFISLQLLIPTTNDKKKGQHAPIFMAEPMRASNSFVGTEEYIAPVCCL
jgi:non-specific serine/threonine protein kinase